MVANCVNMNTLSEMSELAVKIHFNVILSIKNGSFKKVNSVKFHLVLVYTQNEPNQRRAHVSPEVRMLTSSLYVVTK